MMNLKDKKITRCHYVDSKGKTYYVGYGDDLSPEISFTLKTRQVSFLYLLVNNITPFLKGLVKIPYHSLILFMSLMSIYGFLIMIVNNYQVYLTGSFIETYFRSLISIWILFTVTVGSFQQFVLEKKVMTNYLAQLLHLSILYLVCCLFIKSPTFNIDVTFDIPMYNMLLESIEQYILIIFNTIKDYWLYKHHYVVFNKLK